MLIDDQSIINYFFIGEKINNNKIKHYNNFDKHTNIEIYNYLINRFNDNLENVSIAEILNRIKYHIEVRPVCLNCGKPVKYIGNKKLLYSLHCCSKCSNTDPTKIYKEKETKFKKYNNPNFNNREKYHQTCLEKYNQYTYTNREKYHQTCLKKYNKYSIFHIKEIQNKINQIINSKYHVNNISQLEEIKQKKKQTCINKYGVVCGLNTQLAYKNLIKTYKQNKDNIISKIKETKLKKYGDSNYRNKEKYINTCLNKYGINNTFKLEKSINKRLQKFKSQEYKEKISKIFSSPIIQEKINNTKKKNNTFNTSQPEEESYQLLKEKYPDVVRQYRSELYPFNCDFYIPSLDLYIECQYSQFHHHRPYIGNKQDIKDTEILKEKADRIHKQNKVKKSRYDVELETWTIRDVKKRNLAKENKLNYIEFWNLEELKQWI